ncbi:hypothetical protein STEG23_038140 [Scotinomys teguina]
MQSPAPPFLPEGILLPCPQGFYAVVLREKMGKEKGDCALDLSQAKGTTNLVKRDVTTHKTMIQYISLNSAPGEELRLKQSTVTGTITPGLMRLKQEECDLGPACATAAGSCF